MSEQVCMEPAQDTRPADPPAPDGECPAVYTFPGDGEMGSCPCAVVGPHDQHECKHGATWGYVHVEPETQVRIVALESALAARDAQIRDLQAERDGIQHKEIAAAQVEYNAMRDRAIEAERSRDVYIAMYTEAEAERDALEARAAALEAKAHALLNVMSDEGLDGDRRKIRAAQKDLALALTQEAKP